jgi:Meckel syndrome type 1 protein
VFKNSPLGLNAEREQVLMTVEAYPDGSIALTPDFSQSIDDTRRIERRDGSVWEYSIVNASERAETPLEQRTKDIAPTAALRKLQLTRKAAGAFAAPPGEKAGSVRFLALAEIVAARGFDRDYLYCEWVLDYDSDVWRVEGDGAQTSGSTQISKCVKYPATGDGEGDAWGSGDRMVAHWSLPVELSCVADVLPPPSKHPVLYFQVSSYDEWDRYRCEGYGHLNLGSLPVGSSTKLLKTWKAGGTIADRVASQFVGGSPEIGDITYSGIPADAKGKPVHSRQGFVADTSGEIKVRVNVMTQTKADASAAAKKGLGLLKGLLGKGKKEAAGREKYEKKEAVEDVVSRARQRLADARAQNRQNPAAAPRAMLLSRKETEARPAPAQPAPYGYGAPAPAGAATADAIARARARVSAPAAPAIETPAPNMASPPAPPVESIDDDGTVASLGGTTGAGLMSQFEAALGDENAAPATGSEPKPPTEGIAPVDAALAPVP